MPDNDLDDLRKWVEELRQDIIKLHIHRYFFKESEKIIIANPKLAGLPSDYYFYVKGWYEDSISLAIRRLIDTNSKTRSFERFLQQVKRDSTLITRSRYKEVLNWSLSVTAANLDAEFDLFCGVGQKYLPKDVVESDLKALQTELNKIEVFAHQAVAHRQAEPTYSLPGHPDIDLVLQFSGDLLNKYSKLITGVGVSQLLPYMPEDWKAIFRLPWISS